MDSFDPLNPPSDPYLALGVSKSDSLAAIKSAYRKLALKYHPDKCDDSVRDHNIAEFHKIQTAYDILNDEDRRKQYDDLRRLLDLRDKFRKEPSKSGFTPRPPMRSPTFYSDSKVQYEERQPKYFDDDDIPRGNARKTEYEPRRSRAERVRVTVDKDAEDRRRREKMRDADIRSSRNTKYDNDDRYSPRDREYDERERLRRRAEDVKDKYDDWMRNAQRHQTSYDDARPSTRREGTSYPYRPARTSPRERDHDRERERDHIETELRKQREKLASLERERETRRGPRPAFPEDFARRGSDPLTSTTTSPPKVQRAEAMPMPAANTSRRRERESKLREAVLADDCSSSSSSEKSARYTAKPVKTSVRYDTREPRRSRSRSQDRKPTPRRGSYDSPPSRAMPRTRSPEQMGRDEFANLLYERSRAPYGYVRKSKYTKDDVTYQPNYTRADIKYAPVPNGRIPLSRSSTMPTVSSHA